MFTKTAARKNGAGGAVVCLAPDVCKTPVGQAVVPVPYMVLSQLAWAVRTETSVQITDLDAFTMASRLNKTAGDEPGTLGGIKSGVTGGFCRPKTNQTTVTIGGHELVHNDHLFEMNCAGPEGLGNTIGKLVYFEV